MSTVQYKEERAKLLAECKSMVDAANRANRELTSEERSRFDKKMGRIDALGDIIKAQESLDYVAPHTNPMAGWRSNDALMDHAEKNGYSILGAVRSFVDGKGKPDGIFAEVHQELRAQGVRDEHGGVLIPYGGETRAADTTTMAGGKLVNTGTFIDKLREMSLVDRLGITFLKGLQGELKLPRLTGSATVAWVAEGSAIAASNPTADSITLTPRLMAANVAVSRHLLYSGSPEVQSVVSNDIIKSVGTFLDNALLNATGVAPQPTGLLKQGSLPTVAIGATGGAITWDFIAQLEQKLIESDGVVNEGSVKYLTSPRTFKAMKTIAKAANTGIFLYDDTSKTLNSLPVAVSNRVPINLTKSSGTNLSAVVLADWSQYVCGVWGSGFEMVVDQYSRAEYAEVRLIAHHFCDFAPRNLGSFAAIVDSTS